MSQDRIDTFLAQAEAKKHSNRYVIGAFEVGVTLYKQQVRALNLLYSLHEGKRLLREGKIAIVGGGFSGLTAAAAAIALDYEVFLFERRPLLLHLQHGCDTRWVHPHLYDWPMSGSDLPYAGLPILNWREGIVSEVVVQILKSFEQLKERKGRGKFHLHRGASVSFPEPQRVCWSNSLEYPRNGEKIFDAVIFAVGFGVEHGVRDGVTPSYWRNDDLNQPKPGAHIGTKTKILISGTGDGGLIDLLRSTIDSFNQGRILREFIETDEEAELIKNLQRISKDWRDGKHQGNSSWLSDQYSHLHDRGLLSTLKEKLESRLRKDTEVILNGVPERLSCALRLDRASLFNTLLTHSLYSLGGFTYVSGPCELISENEVKIGDCKIIVDRVIIRHGTDKKAVLREAGYAEGVEALESHNSLRDRIDTSNPLWPAGWWGEYILSGKQRVEFVPPATVTIANTFVSTLSDIIELEHRETTNLQYRITLHRLINFNGEEYFQQISRYAGTRREGAVGRVFEVTAGLVGLVCRLGRPIIVRNTNDFEFKEVWNKLNFSELVEEGKARPIDESVQSLLACPFFAPPDDAESPSKYVSLVLFIDSAEENFFNNKVLKVVYAACRGFVKNLERMRRKGEVVFAISEHSGYEYKNTKEDNDFVSAYESVEDDHHIFKNYVKDLTFKKIKSFDADLRLLESYAKENTEEEQDNVRNNDQSRNSPPV